MHLARRLIKRKPISTQRLTQRRRPNEIPLPVLAISVDVVVQITLTPHRQQHMQMLKVAALQQQLRITSQLSQRRLMTVIWLHMISSNLIRRPLQSLHTRTPNPRTGPTRPSKRNRRVIQPTHAGHANTEPAAETVKSSC